MTSHDVVNRMRRLANTRKVGHLGTLDPMATGVLPLILNRATRLAQFFTANDKRYDARIRFGVTTDSYDRDGSVTGRADSISITRDELERALASFRGTFFQTPPPVSAKKVGGVPAYKLARKQIAVELKPVEITVYSLDLIDCEADMARILVHCSGGTYVRSIAHDLGQALGCGAILDELRRTASGDFKEEQSFTLERLAVLSQSGELKTVLLPATQLLPQFPAERVDANTSAQIRQGKDFRTSPFRPLSGSRYVKAIGEDGELVAIGEARLPHVYHPVLVL